jgi:hypothetical protein
MKRLMIETARLQLMACELEHFEAILEDERRLASLLRVTPAEEERARAHTAGEERFDEGFGEGWV